VLDGSGVPIDISAFTEIVWQAGRDYKASPVIVKKKSLGQVTIGGGTGVFTVAILNGDTNGFTGFYAHSAVCTDALGSITTVELGRWQVGPQVPAWTYSGDPQISTRDAVRFYLGDTDSTAPIIYDAEIDALLVTYPNPFFAAAQAARGIAAKYSRKVSKRVGDLSINYSDLSKQFYSLANELQAQGETMGMTPYSGGISRTDKQTVNANTDREKPPFRQKQFDNRSGYNNTSGEPFGDFGDGS
jgi:hypothetical protein